MELVADNLDRLWNFTLSQLIVEGKPLASRDGDSNELLGVTLRLTDITQNFLFNQGRKASPVYAAAELLWYLSGTNDDRMVAYAKQFKRFLNDGVAHGGYGYRWNRGDKDFQDVMAQHKTQEILGSVKPTQLAVLIDFLRRNPNTRQAVLASWFPSDLADGATGQWADIPCTLSVQFLVRAGRLHAVTQMRSNDIWLGTPYDIFAITSLQRLIADELSLSYGEYVHNVGSMHLYSRDREKARGCMIIQPSVPLSFKRTPPGKLGDHAAVVCIQEKRTRTNVGQKFIPLNPDLSGTLLGDLYNLAACQFDSTAVAAVTNEALRGLIPAAKSQEYRP